MKEINFTKLDEKYNKNRSYFIEVCFANEIPVVALPRSNWMKTPEELKSRNVILKIVEEGSGKEAHRGFLIKTAYPLRHLFYSDKETRNMINMVKSGKIKEIYLSLVKNNVWLKVDSMAYEVLKNAEDRVESKFTPEE